MGAFRSQLRMASRLSTIEMVGPAPQRRALFAVVGADVVDASNTLLMRPRMAQQLLEDVRRNEGRSFIVVDIARRKSCSVQLVTASPSRASNSRSLLLQPLKGRAAVRPKTNSRSSSAIALSSSTEAGASGMVCD